MQTRQKPPAASRTAALALPTTYSFAKIDGVWIDRVAAKLARAEKIARDARDDRRALTKETFQRILIGAITMAVVVAPFVLTFSAYAGVR